MMNTPSYSPLLKRKNKSLEPIEQSGEARTCSNIRWSTNRPVQTTTSVKPQLPPNSSKFPNTVYAAPTKRGIQLVAVSSKNTTIVFVPSNKNLLSPVFHPSGLFQQFINCKMPPTNPKKILTLIFNPNPYKTFLDRNWRDSTLKRRMGLVRFWVFRIGSRLVARRLILWID